MSKEPISILPGIYQLPLRIVNVFLIESPDGLTLIDTGPAGSMEVLFEQIRRLGKDPGEIRRIIITHSHHDHSGSLASIQKATGAKVFMHPLEAALLRRGIAFQAPSGILNALLSIISMGYRLRLPFITVEAINSAREINDGDRIPGCEALQVIHAPGHCAGQIALLYAPNGGLLFAADSAKNNRRLTFSTMNEDKRLSLQTLKKIAALEFDKAVFSHGEPIVHNASQRFKKAFAN